MAWLMLILWGPLALGLSLQLLALYLTRARLRFLRWVLLAPLPVPVGMAVVCWLEGGWFWELGVAICLGVGLSYLLGWGLAWGLFARWRRKRSAGGAG